MEKLKESYSFKTILNNREPNISMEDFKESPPVELISSIKIVPALDDLSINTVEDVSSKFKITAEPFYALEFRPSLNLSKFKATDSVDPQKIQLFDIVESEDDYRGVVNYKERTATWFRAASTIMYEVGDAFNNLNTTMSEGLISFNNAIDVADSFMGGSGRNSIISAAGRFASNIAGAGVNFFNGVGTAFSSNNRELASNLRGRTGAGYLHGSIFDKSYLDLIQSGDAHESVPLTGLRFIETYGRPEYNFNTVRLNLQDFEDLNNAQPAIDLVSIGDQIPTFNFENVWLFNYDHVRNTYRAVASPVEWSIGFDGLTGFEDSFVPAELISTENTRQSIIHGDLQAFFDLELFQVDNLNTAFESFEIPNIELPSIAFESLRNASTYTVENFNSRQNLQDSEYRHQQQQVTDTVVSFEGMTFVAGRNLLPVNVSETSTIEEAVNSWQSEHQLATATIDLNFKRVERSRSDLDDALFKVMTSLDAQMQKYVAYFSVIKNNEESLLQIKTPDNADYFYFFYSNGFDFKPVKKTLSEMSYGAFKTQVALEKPENPNTFSFSFSPDIQLSLWKFIVEKGLGVNLTTGGIFSNNIQALQGDQVNLNFVMLQAGSSGDNVRVNKFVLENVFFATVGSLNFQQTAGQMSKPAIKGIYRKLKWYHNLKL